MSKDKILLYMVVLYLISKTLFNSEKMSNTDIKKIISDIYQADIESIRNLSKLANDLTNNGKLRVPGGLEIDGKLIVKDDIKTSKNIYWYNGKGKLIANVHDGANIHLDNNHGKRGVDLYANYANKGSRLILKDQNNSIRNDIWKSMPNTAKVRYVEINNNKPHSSAHLSIKEIRVFDANGTNVAKGKTPKFLGSNKKNYGSSNLNRMTNDHYYPGDNFNHYWHGDQGRYHIQIDLGREYDITQISIYNRWNATVDVRLNETELIAKDGKGHVVRRFQTGQWHRQYSKEYFL